MESYTQLSPFVSPLSPRSSRQASIPVEGAQACATLQRMIIQCRIHEIALWKTDKNYEAEQQQLESAASEPTEDGPESAVQPPFRWRPPMLPDRPSRDCDCSTIVPELLRTIGEGGGVSGTPWLIAGAFSIAEIAPPNG